MKEFRIVIFASIVFWASVAGYRACAADRADLLRISDLRALPAIVTPIEQDAGLEWLTIAAPPVLSMSEVAAVAVECGNHRRCLELTQDGRVVILDGDPKKPPHVLRLIDLGWCVREEPDAGPAKDSRFVVNFNYSSGWPLDKFVPCPSKGSK